MQRDEKAAEHRCANCGAPAPGKFCAECGQPTYALQMPIGVFLKESLRELFALDSRIIRTLVPLVFKPGFVTREYVSGHRATFVPPLRLYIFLSFLLFLTLAIASSDDARVAFRVTSSGDTIAVVSSDDSISGSFAHPSEDQVDSTAANSSEGVEAELERRILNAVKDPERFLADFRGRMAQAMFFLLPVFALELKVLFRKRFYSEHLIFSVYFHCFVFALVILTTAPRIVGLDTTSDLADLLLLTVPVYMFMGLRRTYGEGKWKTLAKTLTLALIHPFIVGATLLGVLFVTLMFV